MKKKYSTNKEAKRKREYFKKSTGRKHAWKRWTPEEITFATTQKLPIPEVAKLLNRSIRAISKMREKHECVPLRSKQQPKNERQRSQEQNNYHVCIYCGVSIWKEYKNPRLKHIAKFSTYCNRCRDISEWFHNGMDRNPERMKNTPRGASKRPNWFYKLDAENQALFIITAYTKMLTTINKETRRQRYARKRPKNRNRKLNGQNIRRIEECFIRRD